MVPPCLHTPWRNGANCRDRGHRSPEGRCPGANPAGRKSPPGSPQALRHPTLMEKGHESLTHPLWVLSRLRGEAVSGVPVPQHPSCPAPPCQQPPLLPLNLCQGLGELLGELLMGEGTSTQGLDPRHTTRAHHGLPFPCWHGRPGRARPAAPHSWRWGAASLAQPPQTEPSHPPNGPENKTRLSPT